MFIVGLLTALFHASPLWAGGNSAFIWKLNGEEAGTLRLESNVGDSVQTIRYICAITLDMGVEVRQAEDWQVSYEGGLLSECRLKNYVNDRLRIDVAESAGAGQRTVNGKPGPLVREPVAFSYVKLFFSEPTGLDQLYSELHGDWFSVRSTGEGTYEVTDSRNRKHRFQYGESGQLERAEVPAPSGVLVLLPVTE